MVYPIADVPSTAHTVDSVPHNFLDPSVHFRTIAVAHRAISTRGILIVQTLPGTANLSWHFQSEFQCSAQIPSFSVNFGFRWNNGGRQIDRSGLSV